MKKEHTPGPWNFEPIVVQIGYSRRYGYMNLAQKQGMTFAELWQDKPLMDAAPELLEALSTTLEALRDLVRQLPTDERLADYRLDFAEIAEEKALTAIKQATE